MHWHQLIWICRYLLNLWFDLEPIMRGRIIQLGNLQDTELAARYLVLFVQLACLHGRPAMEDTLRWQQRRLVDKIGAHQAARVVFVLLF